MFAKMTGSRARAAPQDGALTPALLLTCILVGADFSLSRTFFIFLTCSQHGPRGAKKTQVLIQVCCLPAGRPWASHQRCLSVVHRLNGGHQSSHVPLRGLQERLATDSTPGTCTAGAPRGISSRFASQKSDTGIHVPGLLVVFLCFYVGT